MPIKMKVFLLFLSLICLIIFSIYNYDYNQVLENDDIDNKTRVHNTYDKYKNILFDKYADLKSYISENLYNEKNKTLKKEQELDSSNTITEESKKESSTEVIVQEEKKVLQKDIINKVQELKPKDKVIKKIEEVIKTQNNSQEKKLEKNILSTEEIQEQINKVLAQNKINFKRASVKLTAKSYITVKEVAKLLKKYPKIKVEIGGHTDSKGRKSLNQRISQKRADAVMEVLKNLGIKSTRLSAVGYGEEFPIAKEDKLGLSEENRRVEIKIVER